ncbi:MAG: hypothetical protein COW05_02980, partial [Gammaproteobacteria bacterium CG12_big_fil_rev_8_21_14_0_65_46_12]
ALADRFKDVKTELFHVKGDEGSLIQDMSQLETLDPRFTQSPSPKNQAFPISSGFLKACVMMRKGEKPLA